MARYVAFYFYVVVCCCILAPQVFAQVTLLLPDSPTQERHPTKNKEKMDVLLALIDPFSQQAEDMEMPQMFAVGRITPLLEEDQIIEHKETGKKPTHKLYREELLGNLEEIRFSGKKAWGTHVALETPGLYQLILETRPRYDANRRSYRQEFVKTILPVRGLQQGWDAFSGLGFEIIPLTRPFGLMAPALFSGKVVQGETTLPRVPVTVARLNRDKRGLPSHWHVEQELNTNAQGEFAFVCPQGGWWVFVAVQQGDPLKGSDGQPKKRELAAVLWVYVDDAGVQAYKPEKGR